MTAITRANTIGTHANTSEQFSNYMYFLLCYNKSKSNACFLSMKKVNFNVMQCCQIICAGN